MKFFIILNTKYLINEGSRSVRSDLFFSPFRKFYGDR